jgi:hypothetical protein
MKSTMKQTPQESIDFCYKYIFYKLRNEKHRKTIIYILFRYNIVQKSEKS